MGQWFISRYFGTYKRDLLLQIFSIVQIVYDQSQITFFLIQCNFEKNIFLKFPKLFFYQSHSRAFGLTIPKWYNTWVLKIFFVNIFFKNIFQIFFKIFFQKICPKIFLIPKCYTILESWDRMQSNGFDRKMIWCDFLKKCFSNPLYFQKRKSALVVFFLKKTPWPIK